ncbi:hypothetical protein BUE80_DR005964 [Diplocarpon rosae]|nr:hypothetical protein BUE80_DR005964 [Diplocarpon rosae]
MTGAWLLAGTSSTCQVSLALRMDILKRQLDHLKARLDNMMGEFSGEVESEQEKHIVLRHYYSYEGPAQPGWQNAVVARVEGLLFATSMLYHLCSLQIFGEVRTLTILPKTTGSAQSKKPRLPRQQTREERLTAMKPWGASPVARISLCYAAGVLIAHQNLSRYQSSFLLTTERLCESPSYLPSKSCFSGISVCTLDPLAYIALSVAALVIWAYCTLIVQGYEMCTPSAATIIELTRWIAPGVHYEKEKDTWVETGEGCRIQLQGIQLCRSKLNYFIESFQTFLADDWMATDAIAPGLFKAMS